MTFEDKAEIVFSQLRADRDRLQNAIDKIRAEIQSNRDEWIKGSDPEWHTYDRCLCIIDKHIKGVTDAQEL